MPAKILVGSSSWRQRVMRQRDASVVTAEEEMYWPQVGLPRDMCLLRGQSADRC